MRYFLTLLLLGLFCSAQAIHLIKSDNPHVVDLPIQRRSRRLIQSRITNHFDSRSAGTIHESLSNEQTLYYANVSLGTPPQVLQLHIDTGSSDIWANTGNSSLCSSTSPSPCSSMGTYNANDSSTYEYVNSIFNITYVDHSGASGDYATDTLNIGGLDINDLQFGIGYISSSAEGILGLGYVEDEAQVTVAGLQPYQNLPALLKEHGQTKANAYSLWLNDLAASTGSILFGGVNTEKFSGRLESMPIIPTNGGYSQFVVAVTSLNMNDTYFLNSNQEPLAALLDSGSTLTFLPTSIADPILKRIGVSYNNYTNSATVDCDLANNPGSLQFTFSSASTIAVPVKELVLPGGNNIYGEPYCLFGIAPSAGSTAVLGDTFQRSAYVVYDLENNEIAIAQTRFDSAGDNVLEINGDIPDATEVASPVTTIDGLQSGVAFLGEGYSTSDVAALNPPIRMLAVVMSTGLLFTL